VFRKFVLVAMIIHCSVDVIAFCYILNSIYLFILPVEQLDATFCTCTIENQKNTFHKVGPLNVWGGGPVRPNNLNTCKSGPGWTAVRRRITVIWPSNWSRTASTLSGIVHSCNRCVTHGPVCISRQLQTS